MSGEGGKLVFALMLENQNKRIGMSIPGWQHKGCLTHFGGEKNKKIYQ